MCDVTLNTREAADLLRISEVNLRQRVRAGEFPGVENPYGSRKAGWLIPSSSVEKFARDRSDLLYGEVRARVAGIRQARGMVGCDAN